MSQTSLFDPTSYLSATVTEALTARPPLPAQSVWVAQIKDIKGRQWQGKKDPTQSGIAFDVDIEIDVTQNADLHAKLGYDKVVLKDSIMIATTDNGAIDFAPGKNGRLRQYREAFDMNKAGQPFSVLMMVGKPFKVSIKHEPYEGNIYDKVDAILKA